MKNHNTEQTKLNNLLLALREVNKKIAKNSQESLMLQEKHAYVTAKLQGSIEDRAVIVQQLTDNSFIKKYSLEFEVGNNCLEDA